VLLVAHDHDVIDEVATRIWHFEAGHVEDFKGTYEGYVTLVRSRAAKQPGTRSMQRRAG
jgi:ATPase subunit of ABC transporter with duplicated ATPase domains